MEFLGGRVEGLFLHPVPTPDVGLQVHCPILGGVRDISSVSCDRAEFYCRVYKNLSPSSQSSPVPQFCELSLASRGFPLLLSLQTGFAEWDGQLGSKFLKL